LEFVFGSALIWIGIRNIRYARSRNQIQKPNIVDQSHVVDQRHAVYQSNPVNLDALDGNRDGLAALRSGRFEDAIEFFDRALKASPNDGVLYSNKGIALNELRRNDEAVECYSRAIALHHHGGAPEDWNNKGKALLELGRYDESLACYETAIQIRGLQTLDVLGSLYGKAEALAGLGKYSEAIEVLNLELSLKPNLPKVIKKRDEYISLLNSNANKATPSENVRPVFNDHEFKFRKYKIAGITPVSWEEMTDGRTYEVYRSNTRVKALEFLNSIPTAEIPRLFYIIVETPEGNMGKDMQGIFDEP